MARKKRSIGVWIVKFIFHAIAFPTLCAVFGMAIDRVGVGALISAIPFLGRFVGGFFGVMGAAFFGSLTAIILDRLIFFPLYRRMRGKEYKDGEYAYPA